MSIQNKWLINRRIKYDFITRHRCQNIYMVSVLLLCIIIDALFVFWIYLFYISYCYCDATDFDGKRIVDQLLHFWVLGIMLVDWVKTRTVSDKFLM